MTLRMPPPPQVTGTVTNADGPAGVRRGGGLHVRRRLRVLGLGGLDLHGGRRDLRLHARWPRGPTRGSGSPPTGQVGEYWNDKADVESADDVVVVGRPDPGGQRAAGRPAARLGHRARHRQGVQGANVTAEELVVDDGFSYWDQVGLRHDRGERHLHARGAARRLPHPVRRAHLHDRVLQRRPRRGGRATSCRARPRRSPASTRPSWSAAKITGTVRDNASAPLQFINVTAYRLIDGEWDFIGQRLHERVRGLHLDGLRAGTYRVGFQDFNDTLPRGVLPRQGHRRDRHGRPGGPRVARPRRTRRWTGVAHQRRRQRARRAGAPVAAVTLYMPSTFAQSGWSWAPTSARPRRRRRATRSTGLRPGATGCCVTRRRPGWRPECWNDKAEVFAADTLTAPRTATTIANMVLASRHG